jgi:hypothetical protein
MKTIVLALLVLCSTLQSFAQPKIAVGKNYPAVKTDARGYFHKDGEILALKVHKKDGVTIQKQSGHDFSFQGIQVYDDFPKRFVMETALTCGGRFYAVYSWWDGAQEHLDAREIDFKSGKFAGPGIELLTVNRKVLGDVAVLGFYKWGVINKYNFNFSNDSARLVVSYELEPKDKTESRNVELGVALFDCSLKPVWSREVEIPYTEKKLKILDFHVDQNETIRVMSKVYSDNTKEEKNFKGERNYRIEILQIARSATDPVKIPVDVKNAFVQSLKIVETSDGPLVCVGYYNGGKKALNVDGVILFSLGEGSTIVNMRTHEVPLDILNKDESNARQRSNEQREEEDNAELKNMILREVVVERSGEMLLVGEQYLARMSAGPNAGPTYYYDDILLTRVSPTGELIWMKKLPKRQMGYESVGRMSYQLIRQGSQCFFFFLDAANQDLPAGKRPRVYVDNGAGFVTTYKLNMASGDVSKMYLLNTRDSKGYVVCDVRPTQIFDTGYGEFVLEAFNRVVDKDALFKITLEP